jgi:hypothetical protein
MGVYKMSYNPDGISQSLHDMVPGPAAVATPRVIYASEDGILFCYGLTVPSDAATGYAPGCIFIHVDGTTVSRIYMNIATKASADFNLVTTAA